MAKTGYDKNLDIELFSESVKVGKNRFKIVIYSYNKGNPKLQIIKEFKQGNGDYSICRLGRMTHEEVESIFPLIDRSRKVFNIIKEVIDKGGKHLSENVKKELENQENNDLRLLLLKHEILGNDYYY